MIKINLLPSAQKKQTSKIQLQVTPYIPIIFLVILFMLGLNILLGLFGIFKKVQFIALNNKWRSAQPKMQEIEKLKADIKSKKQQISTLGSLTVRNFYITTLLNKINKSIPDGLWLSKLSIKSDGLSIEGSVFNFGIDEITKLNSFFNDLKNDDFFKLNFSSVDLASVRRRQVKDYEIVDFLLKAQILNSDQTKAIEQSKQKKKK